MERVKVYIRVRPETVQQPSFVVKGSNEIVFRNRDTSRQNKLFKCDGVLDEDASQEQVFEVVVPLINSVVEGYNATIFAYGCTGSGKTDTMSGSRSAGEYHGVIPRAINQLFTLLQDITDAQEDALCAVSMSYVELYNDNFRDLLSNQKSHENRCGWGTTVSQSVKRIQVHEDPNSGVYLTGSPSLRTPVTSARDALKLLQEGEERRTFGATMLNDRSSRSHTILTLNVELRIGGKLSQARMGKLHLIDLAGSERVSLSGVQENALRETKSINKSLSLLGDVLSAVSAIDHKSKKHIVVPYRNSKLTFFLKDSLGGNAKTAMITTLRKSLQYHQQTFMSLLYASRAQKIQNVTHVNIDSHGNSHVEKLYQSIIDLKKRLKQREREIHALRDNPDMSAFRGSARPADENADPRDSHAPQMEEIKRAYEVEQLRLKEQLSKVIHSQEGQLQEQRSRSLVLTQKIKHFQETINEQQQEITSLRRCLGNTKLSSDQPTTEARTALVPVHQTAVQTSAMDNGLTVDDALSRLSDNTQAAHVSSMMLHELRKDLSNRTERCVELQELVDQKTRETDSLKRLVRLYKSRLGRQGSDDGSQFDAATDGLVLENERLRAMLAGCSCGGQGQAPAVWENKLRAKDEQVASLMGECKALKQLLLRTEEAVASVAHLKQRQIMGATAVPRNCFNE